MKITFVMGSGFNMTGGDRVIERHARQLQARGHHVQVVSRAQWRPSLQQRIKSLLRGKGWPSAKPHPSHFDGSPVPHRRIESYRPVEASDLPGADVVIATWWETAPWVAALPPEKGAKAYFIQHYEAFDDFPAGAVDATWRLDLHKITISRWLVDLAHDFGDDDVDLVPNSVDLALFDAAPRGKQPVPTVGFLYHVAPWKGVPVAIAATAELVKSFPQVRLMTFGEWDFTARLPAGIIHEHRTHPPQHDIRNLYAQCDVWLCASTSEGFGLTALEAMACRCPVVSTQVGGPLDFIQDGVNGYLARIDDVEGLAAHLKTVLAAPEVAWRRMSDAAYATATSYTWEDAAALFEAGLRRAIERNDARNITG